MPESHQFHATGDTLVDEFGELIHKKGEIEELYILVQSLKRELEYNSSILPGTEELSLLRDQIQEIQQLQLKENEEVELRNHHQLIANSQKIFALLKECLQALEGNQSVQERLEFCRRELTQFEKIDPHESQNFIAKLETINLMSQELIAEMTSYIQAIDFDLKAIAQLEERMAEIYSIKRKYGGSIRAALDYAKAAEEKVDYCQNIENNRKETLKRLHEIEQDLSDKSNALSSHRAQQIPLLSNAITDKLQYLGFNGCVFSIQLTRIPVSSTGIDAIEFTFSPNPGEGTKSLRSIASSGEISRVMLAIKTTLAKADQVPILIFDEIDANIGGDIAVKVGKEMAKLGRDHQIICITHLPQVAAGADRHFLVNKLQSSGRTIATIFPIMDADLIKEIARMMGSPNPSTSALAHATELSILQKQ